MYSIRRIILCWDVIWAMPKTLDLQWPPKYWTWMVKLLLDLICIPLCLKKDKILLILNSGASLLKDSKLCWDQKQPRAILRQTNRLLTRSFTNMMMDKRVFLMHPLKRSNQHPRRTITMSMPTSCSLVEAKCLGGELLDVNVTLTATLPDERQTI